MLKLVSDRKRIKTVVDNHKGIKFFHYRIFADGQMIANGEGKRARAQEIAKCALGYVFSGKHEKAGIVLMHYLLSHKISIELTPCKSKEEAKALEDSFKGQGANEDNEEKMNELIARRGVVHPEMRMLINCFKKCGDSFMLGLIANAHEPLVREFFSLTDES